MSSNHNWMVLNDVEKGGVWHYTNRAGLRGILENQCLWSTARTGLNDPLEVTHAIEEMRRTWQHYRGSSQLVDDVPREDVDDLIDYLANEIESMDLFFTSGSTTGDKLEHWKGYGSDQDIRSASKTAPGGASAARTRRHLRSLNQRVRSCVGARWTTRSSSPSSADPLYLPVAAPSKKSFGPPLAVATAQSPNRQVAVRARRSTPATVLAQAHRLRERGRDPDRRLESAARNAPNPQERVRTTQCGVRRARRRRPDGPRRHDLGGRRAGSPLADHGRTRRTAEHFDRAGGGRQCHSTPSRRERIQHSRARVTDALPPGSMTHLGCQASALSTVATPPPVNVAESGISTSRARDRPTTLVVRRSRTAGTRPNHPSSQRLTSSFQNGVSKQCYGDNFRYAPGVELGYARVSTTKQDLDRQIDALTMAGIDPANIYVDKKSGPPPIAPD